MVEFLIESGYMIAATPSIKSMLDMLDPIMFPTAMSEDPDVLAKIFTISSGILVPIDTIVRPITISDTLYFLAMDADPATNQSAPFISKTNPMAKRIYTSILKCKYVTFFSYSAKSYFIDFKYKYNN